jgi:dinuclear metal center YbgI/SA1388 family protein
MQVKDICKTIESVAPLHYQEDYDNAGLIIGSPEQEVTQILLCLDSTEAVIDEAIAKGCNLVIAHHPLIFKGLKKINGRNDIERTVIKAIENKIAIYAAHTNLDNVLRQGVNQKFAQKLGLKNVKILQEKPNQLVKIVFYTPASALENLKDVLFHAGAGHIGHYSECSFASEGQGTFKPEIGANPTLGEIGKREQENEYKVETVAPFFMANRVVYELKKAHPYEEMAFEIIPLTNKDQGIGAGVIGELENSMNPADFLNFLKKSLNLEVIKHTSFAKEIKKVALCGGSGSFLLGSAMSSNADVYITADVKYHEFFDAIGTLMFCDIGHYESEISTLELFYEEIQDKFPNFAVHFCETSTNPIHYHK